MNLNQKISLSLGLAVIILLCLCPPYNWVRTAYNLELSGVTHRAGVLIENAGHHRIWQPPEATIGKTEDGLYSIRTINNAQVDWPRLSIYVGAVLISNLFGAFVLSRK